MDTKMKYIDESMDDIDRLMSFLKYVNSEYIDIKSIKKDIKDIANNYDKED